MTAPHARPAPALIHCLAPSVRFTYHMIHWHVYLSGQVPDSSTPRGNIAGQSAAKDSYILAGDVVNIVMKRRADDCSEVSVAFFNGAERAHQFVVGFKGHATESDGLWVASFVAIGDGKADGERLDRT